jgi:hypothetical protein
MISIALQKKFKHIIKKILPENDPENEPFSSRFPTRKQWFFLPKNYASAFYRKNKT